MNQPGRKLKACAFANFAEAAEHSLRDAVQAAMKQPALTILAVGGLLLAATLGSAEPAQPAVIPPPAATAAPTVPAASATNVSGKAGATAITAGLPRYAPPPKQAPKKPAADVETEDEAGPDGAPLSPDQPKNKIIRLPRYIVEGDRPPVFRERDIYTKQALAAIAMRRYLSGLDRSVLNRFTLPLVGMSQEKRAMAMYDEDARLQDISDLKNAAANASKAGDKAESDYLLRETNATFLRSGGMDWNSWSK
jgi:hypothetical protein